MLLDPATVDLVAASGAWATYQPGFLTTFGPQIVDGGTDRFLTVLGGRQLLDAGVPLTLASDHPAGPLDPLVNLRHAVHRTIRGRPSSPMLTGGGRPRAHHDGGGVDRRSRARRPHRGEPADLAICDGDPFTPRTRVTQTWVAGRRV